MLEKCKIVIKDGKTREVIPIISAKPTRGIIMSIKDMKRFVSNTTRAEKA